MINIANYPKDDHSSPKDRRHSTHQSPIQETMSPPQKVDLYKAGWMEEIQKESLNSDTLLDLSRDLI